MITRESEHDMQRYLSGAMSHTEEEEFFISVAVDTELRRTLRAHRVVESAIAKQRDAIPTDHGATRAHVLRQLNLPETTPPSSATDRPPVRRFHTSWMLGGLGLILMFAAATLLIDPFGTGSAATTPSSPSYPAATDQLPPNAVTHPLPDDPRPLRSTAPLRSLRPVAAPDRVPSPADEASQPRKKTESPYPSSASAEHSAEDEQGAAGNSHQAADEQNVKRNNANGDLNAPVHVDMNIRSGKDALDKDASAPK